MGFRQADPPSLVDYSRSQATARSVAPPIRCPPQLYQLSVFCFSSPTMIQALYLQWILVFVLLSPEMTSGSDDGSLAEDLLDSSPKPVWPVPV